MSGGACSSGANVLTGWSQSHMHMRNKQAAHALLVAVAQAPLAVQRAFPCGWRPLCASHCRQSCNEL